VLAANGLPRAARQLPEGETAYWIEGLTVPLRHYQYEALLWMVHEETADNGMLRR
jgi:hypothetical protein